MPDDRDRTTKGTFAAGNRAAMSSGLANGLGLTKLPKGCSTVGRQLAALRRTLTDTAGEVHHGRLTPVHHGLIASAVAHERRKRLAERWLAVRWDRGDLTTDEFERLTDIIGTATEQRDRATAALLNTAPPSPPPAPTPERSSGGLTLDRVREAMIGGYVEGSGQAEDLAGK